MERRELTDPQWAALRPHLPPQVPTTGRPNLDHRTVLDGICWVLRTGAPWRDVPARFGKWATAYSRFRRWQAAGVWDRLLAALQRLADADGRLDWTLHFVDGTTIRAHPHAAGAKGGDPNAEALGRGRGGFSTKLHVRAERGGKPVVLLVTPGQRHEQTTFMALMERGAVRRARGRPRVRPARVAGDKGYSGRKIRRYLRRRGIGAVIPRPRREPRRGVRFDRAAYRERNVIERTINRLKQYRRVATRYEKRGAHFLAMVVLAACLLWI